MTLFPKGSNQAKQALIPEVKLFTPEKSSNPSQMKGTVAEELRKRKDGIKQRYMSSTNSNL